MPQTFHHNVVGPSKKYFLQSCSVGWGKLWWALWLFGCHFPLVHLWFALFIHLRMRVLQNTSIILFLCVWKGNIFATIWFLCKCPQWLWSHPNPSTHHTSSLTLVNQKKNQKPLWGLQKRNSTCVSVCMYRQFILKKSFTKIKWI